MVYFVVPVVCFVATDVRVPKYELYYRLGIVLSPFHLDLDSPAEEKACPTFHHFPSPFLYGMRPESRNEVHPQCFAEVCGGLVCLEHLCVVRP